MQHAHVELARGGAELGQNAVHNGKVFKCQQIPLALAAVECKSFFALFVLLCESGVHVADAREFLYIKVFFAAFKHSILVKAFQIAHHAVGGEHYQTRVLHIHKVDHLVILRVAFL